MLASVVRTCVALAVAVALLCLVGPAFAVHQTGVFELDGDTIPLNQAPPVGPADDFDSVFLGTDHAYDHAFIDDSAEPDGSVHFAGNKDEDPIGAWKCIVKSNVTNKLDVRHSYYAAYNVGGDAIAYIGADRDTTDGDADMGFWFFQDRVACDPATGTFTGHKTDGDLLVTAPMTGGGTQATINVYRWTDPTPNAPESGDESLVLAFSGDCSTIDQNACGLANGTPINVAWETTRNPIAINAFVEAGINLSVLQPNTCYRTLMAESRSSQQITASLEDFTLAQIFTCGSISVEKVTDPSGASQLFDFETAGQPANPALPAVSDSFQLKDGDPTHATLNLQPGTYSVTEGVVPANWALTAAKCRGGAFGTGTAYNNGVPFPLAMGDKVVCTFVNTFQTPPPDTTLTVDKVTIPANDPQLFPFSIGGPTTDAFSLADADPSHTTIVAGAGSYTIAETVPSGWDLTGIVCEGGPFGTGAPYQNGATIVLATGDKVVCTFTDTLRAPPPSTSITVTKVTIPSGSATPFSFTTAGGPTSISDAFTLTDGQTHTTDVKPGTYTVTENVPAGWAQSASCAGGPFGSGAAYGNGDPFAVSQGDQVLCTFTNFQARPGTQNFCAKAAVRDILSPAGTRFKNNKGVDHVVFAHQGESIQTALDLINDVNGDGYVIIGVVAATPVNGTSAYGGNVTQHFEVNRAYPVPFALLGCSVTVHDDDRGNGQPTARITAAASNPSSSPANPTFTKQANIFVMDLHGADSEAQGWAIEGQGRELRSVNASGSQIGLQIVGTGNTVQNGVVQGNLGAGISVQGSGNVLNSVDSMANQGHGVRVTGDSNQLVKLDLGDIGKGNGGDGANISGAGNTLSEISAFANAGHGISVTGSNTQVLKAFAGDKRKGNGADGIRVAGPGNLLRENRASANHGNGIDVSGGTAAAPNRLRGNQSNLGLSGSATENGGGEYRLLNAVTNYGGGNKADAVLVPKTTIPAKCPTFPATNVTVNLASPVICE